MIDKKKFDDSIGLLLDRVSGVFKPSFDNPCLFDIDYTLDRLLETINIEEDSLIQIYIKDDVQNIKTLFKEIKNYTKLMSNQEHKTYRDKICNILFSIQQKSKIFYEERLSEEE